MIAGTTYARIVVPELIIGLSLLVVLARLHVSLGMWTIAVGHTVLDSAFVTVIVSARLAARDRSVDDAARDLYATELRAFRRVMLPDIMPGIVAGALLAFTFSLDDVVTSFFLSGSTVTLPLVILGLVRVTVTPEVNAIGVALMTTTLVTMLGFLAVNRRWSARRLGTGGGATTDPLTHVATGGA